MSNECGIATSTNNAGRMGRLISFNTFPRKGDVGKRWIVACKRADDFILDTLQICSEHFVALRTI